MPKRSKEDTAITIQTILDVAIEQILNLGYDQMSYTTLSEQTGISRTGISHHFPRKTDFVIKLDSELFLLFTSYLELEKGVQRFRESWIHALNDTQFIAILRLIFHHITSADGAIEFSQKELSQLSCLIKDKFGADAERELEWLLGRSLVAVCHVE